MQAPVTFKLNFVDPAWWRLKEKEICIEVE